MNEEPNADLSRLKKDIDRLDKRVDDLTKWLDKHYEKNNDDFTVVNNALAHLKEKSNFDYASLKQLQTYITNAMIFISGVLAGMHYPEAAAGLKQVYGLLELGDKDNEDH